jgi:hypothetical protein
MHTKHTVFHVQPIDAGPVISKHFHLLETGVKSSVAEPHYFYAAPAPGENFDAAPAPTLLYSKAKVLKNELKFKYRLKLLYLFYMTLYDLQYIGENMN